MTSKSNQLNQFIFVPTAVLNLVKFPEAVCKILAAQTLNNRLIWWAGTKADRVWLLLSPTAVTGGVVVAAILQASPTLWSQLKLSNTLKAVVC